MHIVIVANGDFSETPAILACLKQADKLLACDNGASFCESHGRLPDLVIGDLDSLPQEIYTRLQDKGVAFDIYPSDKDMTDLEIALHYAVNLKPRVITLIAALGGRLDQSLANLLLLTHPKLRCLPFVVRDANSSVILIQPGWHYRWQTKADAVFSLLPLEAMQAVNLTGVRYPLVQANLDVGYSLSVSNSMLSECAELQLGQGLAWLVVNDTAPVFYFECLDNVTHPGKISDLV